MSREKVRLSSFSVPSFAIFALGSVVVACGGRTATGERNFLEGEGVLSTGDITEVPGDSSATETGPTSTGNGGRGSTSNGVTGSGGSTSSPGPGGTSNTPTRPSRPGGGTNSTASTTSSPTSPAVSTTTTSNAPTSGTVEPTSSQPTWTSSPTSTDVTTVTTPTTSSSSTTAVTQTTEPVPPPPDMFDLPEGQAPFGLPESYADLPWVDDRGSQCGINWGWGDEQSCTEGFSCQDTSSGSIDCRSDGETWSCDCSNSARVTFPAEMLPGDGPSDPCRAGVALCFTELPVSENESCDNAGYASDYDCSQQQACSSVHSANAGPIEKSDSRRSVSCNADGNGGSSCWCGEYADYYYRYTLQFQVNGPVQGACDVGLGVCADGMAGETLTPVECSLQYRQFFPDNCSRGYTCAQTGTSGDSTITFTRDVSAHCEQAEGDNWNCYCDVLPEAHVLTSESSEQACTDFGPTCEALMSERGLLP